MLNEISQRKGVEKVLIKSKNHYQNILDNAPIGIFHSSPEGKLYDVNQNLSDILGYKSPKEHISIVNETNVKECVYVDKEKREKIVEKALKDNLWHSHECKLYRKDGNIIIVELSMKAVRNSNSSVKYLEGFIKDITKRKKAEEHFRRDVERESFILELYKKAPQLTDKELYDCTLDHAVRLTGSSIGFFHLISDDQNSIILNTWNNEALMKCNAPFKNHYPIEQAGNWTDCIEAKGPVVYNDFENSNRKNGFPEGHVPVKRFISVPVFDEDKVKFIFGVGNKIEEYDDYDVIQVQSVANELYKIIKQCHWEKALKESENRYRKLLENSFDAVVIHEGNKIISANNIAMDLLGVKNLEKVSDKSLFTFVHPDCRKIVTKRVQQMLEEGNAAPPIEQKFLRIDGTPIDVEVLATGFTYEGKKAIQVVFRDISHRKEVENKIKASLKEKEVLLKEIHHRVKNNLQIISSLLELQKRYIEDVETVNVLQESQNRVKSMAMIHEMLYQSNNLSNIKFSDYIKNLVQDLLYSYGKNNNIKSVINADQIFLNIETAIPCGLIISELVSNSLKYAFPANVIRGPENKKFSDPTASGCGPANEKFADPANKIRRFEDEKSSIPATYGCGPADGTSADPDDRTGEILVNIHSNNEEIEIIISDNGIGFPEELDFKSMHTSLGLKLVNLLVKQLDGSIELDRTNGTEFKIKFKEVEYEKKF